MREPDPAARPRASRPHWALLGVITVVVLVLDQLSKDWAVRELTSRTIDVVWTLRLHLTFNKGTAFSLGGDRGQLIAAIAVAVVAFVLYTERNDRSTLGAVARGLVVGGALGNLADRLLRDRDLDGGFLSGRVVDFIDLQWWPVFNVADAAVVVGCILLVVTNVFRRPEQDQREQPDEPHAADIADVAG